MSFLFLVSKSLFLYIGPNIIINFYHHQHHHHHYYHHHHWLAQNKTLYAIQRVTFIIMTILANLDHFYRRTLYYVMFALCRRKPVCNGHAAYSDD